MAAGAERSHAAETSGGGPPAPNGKKLPIWFPFLCRNHRRPDVFLNGIAHGPILMLGTILIIILILLLLGALPTWGYSSGWGYYPSGTLGLVLVVIIVLALMGRL